jgi:hypothetical protein
LATPQTAAFERSVKGLMVGLFVNGDRRGMPQWKGKFARLKVRPV